MMRSCDSRSSVSQALCSARAACSANCSTIATTHRRMAGCPLPRSTTTAPSPCRRSRSSGTTSTFRASGMSDASRGSVCGSIARRSWLARSFHARDTASSTPTARSVGISLSVQARSSRSPCGGREDHSSCEPERGARALREGRRGCPRLRDRCPPEPPCRTVGRGRASASGAGARSPPRTTRFRGRTPTIRRS